MNGAMQSLNTINVLKKINSKFKLLSLAGALKLTHWYVD